MELFGNRGHIKSTKKLERALTKEHYLTPKERKVVGAKATKFLHQPSGLSKEEWRKKIARPLEKNTKDIIDIGEARRLRKLGK